MPRSCRMFIDPDSRDQEIRKIWIASLGESCEKDSTWYTYVFTLSDHTICVIGAIRRPIWQLDWLARTANEIILGIMKLEWGSNEFKLNKNKRYVTRHRMRVADPWEVTLDDVIAVSSASCWVMIIRYLMYIRSR